jgi:hypothetical protein
MISVRIDELVLATPVDYPQELAGAVETELATRLGGADSPPEGLAATIAAACERAIREEAL